jgi:hypothetical protein
VFMWIWENRRREKGSFSQVQRQRQLTAQMNDSVKWVLCSQVALDRFPFWRIRVRIDICWFGSADLDLHMSCGKETSARPN